MLRRPGVKQAAPGVVRVLGTACGLAVSGSGWVVRPRLVVTAAHVVAGETDTVIQLDAGTGQRLAARAVLFDPKNDIAFLRVPAFVFGRSSRRPRSGRERRDPRLSGERPVRRRAGRLGETVTVLTEDAYGRRPVRRTVTSLRGLVRHGNSGGPAVNANGAVTTTVFAARVGAPGGYGVPTSIVRDKVSDANRPVSTGPCVR